MGGEINVPAFVAKVSSETRNRISILPNSNFLDVANLFKVLGDATRIHIMYALMENTELCVQELSQYTQMNAPSVSHHLRILRQSNLVRQKRNGKQIFLQFEQQSC